MREAVSASPERVYDDSHDEGYDSACDSHTVHSTFKQSAGPCSCHPRPRPEQESKWPACVGAGRGCRGGRTEDGPDKY